MAQLTDLPTGIQLGLIAAPLLAFGAGWVWGELCGWRASYRAIGPRPLFWACPHCGHARPLFRCDPKPSEASANGDAT